MFSPTVIDPNGSFAGNPANPLYGVFVWNNSLVCLLFENDLTAGVWQSTDAGATWARIDGATNRPSGMESIAAVMLSANVMLVAWNDNSGPPSEILLQTFDFSTGLWGSALPASAAVAASIEAVYSRPSDGHVLVLYSYAGPPQLGSGWGLAEWSGSWATSDAGTQIAALPGFDDTEMYVSSSSIFSVLDPATSILHCIVQTFSSGVEVPGAQWNNLYFYQPIEANSTLGSLFLFPGNRPLAGPQDLTTINEGSPAASGAPVIVGDQIIAPFVRTIPGSSPERWYPTLYIGTPLSAPVWSLIAAPTGIDQDAAAAAGSTPDAGAALSTDGVHIFAAWEYASLSTFDIAIRISVTLAATPAIGWVASTAYDPGSGFIAFPLMRDFSGQQLLSANFSATWYGNFIPVTPPGPALNSGRIEAAALAVIPLPNAALCQ
jgi:hypothetical protein